MVNPEFQTQLLPNGLRIIHAWMPREVTHCALVVNAGTRDEGEGEAESEEEESESESNSESSDDDEEEGDEQQQEAPIAASRTTAPTARPSSMRMRALI